MGHRHCLPGLGGVLLVYGAYYTHELSPAAPTLFFRPLRMNSPSFADLHNSDDIRRLVGAFYSRVRADDLLGPFFASRIPDGHWPEHLDTMTRFWTAALLAQAAGYRGNPGAKHLFLPITEDHFTRWLLLFGQAIDELFTGDNATEMKLRAKRMGEMFQAKIAMARASNGHPIV